MVDVSFLAEEVISRIQPGKRKKSWRSFRRGMRKKSRNSQKY